MYTLEEKLLDVDNSRIRKSRKIDINSIVINFSGYIYWCSFMDKILTSTTEDHLRLMIENLRSYNAKS